MLQKKSAFRARLLNFWITVLSHLSLELFFIFFHKDFSFGWSVGVPPGEMKRNAGELALRYKSTCTVSRVADNVFYWRKPILYNFECGCITTLALVMLAVCHGFPSQGGFFQQRFYM